MTTQRRAFNLLPEYFRTDQNNREYYIADDVMYEPEQADFLIGYIGDPSAIDAEDLKRNPLIVESDPSRQKYQLSIGAAYIDPLSADYVSGSFYMDLVNQISSNGGYVNDPNRLFAVPFYSWTPPIDYDKHINFSRYFWTGAGSADVNGEYVTKEVAGSQIVLYETQNGQFVKVYATISNGLPASAPTGAIYEDSSTIDRLLFQWTGSSWTSLEPYVVSTLPADTSGYLNGQYLYVGRSGPDYQRPLLWMYSAAAGRWLAQPVVINPITPDSPRDGMIWEDVTVNPYRRLRRYENGVWNLIQFTTQAGPSGVGIDGQYVYDSRPLSQMTDPWSTTNWWRHWEDLSPADRDALGTNDQAVRPILEFWNGIESVAGDVKDYRNDSPKYQMYAYRYASDDIQPVVDAFFPGAGTQGQTTLYQYKVGAGAQDPVLGIPLDYNSSGEYQFEVTLETQTVNLTAGALLGYRMYKDTYTGYIHLIWEKSDQLTHQTADSNGLYNVPVNLSSNPDHEVLTVASRSQFLVHMTSIIGSQNDFSGTNLGLNNYRWTKKDPTIGATIIDCEKSLLRSMATLQTNLIQIPDSIRQIAKEYNKVLFKFTNRMNQRWDDNTLGDPAGHLYVTPTEAVDSILTELFVGRTPDFPFYYSDMGTYMETQVSNGVAVIIDSNPQPIFIPDSPPRLNASPVYKPEKFLDHDGITKLRGHEGIIVPSFGDDRDLIWLELQNRFFAKVPTNFKTESNTYSARFVYANFYLSDYYGNYVPETQLAPVSKVVNQLSDITSPTPGMFVFTKDTASFASWDGARWLTRVAMVDSLFLNTEDSTYYNYNGLGTFPILSWNRPYAFDYSFNEYRNVVRRDFERWVTQTGINYNDNTTFDSDNPFTWNYTSAGVEGNYMGIYKRIYNTIRPYSHPWEVMGYTIEPTWWRTHYVPTSTATDGSPRYARTHQMWTDFQNGLVNPITGLQKDEFKMIAPIPVDANGELLNPIDAGVVDPESLDMARIDEAWIFGDGGPVEQEFYNSPLSCFSIALAGYLMKPGVWTDILWSLSYIDIGTSGANRIWRNPHVVHFSTLTRPKVADLPVNLQLDSNDNIQFNLGINAWISDRVQIQGADPTKDFGQIIQNTNTVLGWQTSGYINGTRTVVSTLGGKRIPYEDLHVNLHQSSPIQELFCSGVLITRELTGGYRVYGYDMFNPFFTIEVPAVPSVVGQIELRQELIATANQHDFTVTDIKLPSATDTAGFAILVNGYRLKSQHYTVTGPTTFSIESIVEINEGDLVVPTIVTTQQSNTTRTRQFSVNGVSFYYYTTGTGINANIEYGRYFDNPNDVINFMMAYGRALTKAGWVFDSIDPNSGEMIDWLYGAKQFATWVLNVQSPWNPNGIPLDLYTTFMFSPIAGQAKITVPFGNIVNVESLQYGAYGIVNNNTQPIDSDNIFTSRVGDTLTATVVAGSDSIYGIRVFITEYQHVVFFSNVTRFNDIIYDPLLAIYTKALRVDSYRTTNWNGRLEAPGFVIYNGELLPNFEKQAFDFTRFYDRINTVDDPNLRDQARNLYGYDPTKDYMDAIGADDRSRFDYYRGMIHAKGTIRPMTAFARGTRLGASGVLIDEDWAWKLNQFGDTRKEFYQFYINPDDFREQVQIVKFGGPENLFNDIVEILDFDRSNPNANPQWITPPHAGDTSLTNVVFPVTPTGIPDINVAKFDLRTYDTTTSLTVLNHFHYDPDLGRFDPEALILVDYRGNNDPALYTNGPGLVYSNDLSWGEAQVGNYWWNYKRRVFTAYRSVLPNYEIASRDWGKLKYYIGQASTTSDSIAIQTIDPYSNQPAPHGLVVGDITTISGFDDADLNGEVVITAVPTPTSFEYQIATAIPDTINSTIRVTIGAIEIYEWVRSPVAPKDWATYINTLTTIPGSPTGTVDDPDNASYVEGNWYNETTGKVERVFYFWIKNNSGLNAKKSMTASDLQIRISDPTISDVAWFAPVDKTYMFVFVDGETMQQGYALELTIDERDMETHVEWTLITEGDVFNSPQDVIVNKIEDSLGGVDVHGTPVPFTLLSDTEKYGNAQFPPQTIFRDLDMARQIYITTINTLFQNKNITDTLQLTKLFQLSTENTYWKRVPYIEAAYKDQKIFDTVATYAVRDSRQASKSYAFGDLIKVIESDQVDPWTSNQIPATYLYQDADPSFLLVGVDNSTFALNDTLFNDPVVFRQVFEGIYEALSVEEKNDLVFTMLYEMMHQNNDCDWFFKTSYLTTHIFETFSNAPYVKPNEVDAIVSNILDTKPYRTKIRTGMFTYSNNPEPMEVNLIEFPDKKITLIYDRLTCNPAEVGGWDGYPWDTELKGWDKPFWEFEDLGRQEFQSLGVIRGSTTTNLFVFASLGDPSLYNIQIVIRLNGVQIDPTTYGLNVTITFDHNNIIVSTSTPLSNNFTVEALQALGFYEGSEPTLPQDLLDESFTATPSSWQDAVSRSMVPGVYNPTEHMMGCALDGNSPEERINGNLLDSVTICVKTDFTIAYNGWDTTPWDSTGWDSAPNDIGRRIFFILAGNQGTIPAGEVIINTSMDYIAGDTPYIIGDNNGFNIVQVLLNGRVQQRGVNYDLVSPFTNIIQFKTLNDINYTADGVHTTFDVSYAQNGVEAVYVDNILQSQGTDYTVSGNTLSFVQPPPVSVPTLEQSFGATYYGDNSNSTFYTHAPAGSLNGLNSFVFVNKKFQASTAYLTDTSGNVLLNTAPSSGIQVSLFSLGNTDQDSDAIFVETLIVGDGATTLFDLRPTSNNFRTFVFVGGVYQVLGTDYTHPAQGQIQFTTAPGLGTQVFIRDLDLDQFVSANVDHIVFDASGTDVDQIPGVSGSNTDQIMVFLGGDIQDGYSTVGSPDYYLTVGTPDEIHWTEIPAAGTKITVRLIRNIVLDQTLIFNMFPSMGAAIRIIPNPNLDPGDIVTFVYNGFPLGPLGTFVITDSPAPYDIDKTGYLKFNAAIPALNQELHVTYVVNRISNQKHSLLVRTPRLVDDVLINHTDYDSPNGFEDNRPVGITVVDMTLNEYFRWDGTAWVSQGAVNNGDTFFVVRPQNITTYDGTTYTVVFNVGDAYVTPPVIDYPKNGLGVAYGGYALGQLFDSPINFPEAYQIVQHPGDFEA